MAEHIGVRLDRRAVARARWFFPALHPWVVLLAAVLGVFATPARAQSTSGNADLHGPLPTASADPADPLTVWAPPTRSPARFSVFALGEYGAAPVTVTLQQLGTDGQPIGEPQPSEPLMRSVAGVNLSARLQPHWRLGLVLTAPVLSASYQHLGEVGFEQGLASTTTVGDLRLAAPIGLVAPRDGSGFGVGLVPFVTLPTGRVPLVHEGSMAGGGWAAAGWRADRWAVDLSLGASLGEEQRLELVQLRGPVTGLVGAAASVGVAPGLWVGAETRITSDVPVVTLPRAVDRAGTAGEVLATVRGRFGSVWAAGAAGAGLISGPGAGSGRAFAGVGWADGEPAAPQGERVEPRWIFVVEDGAGPVPGAEITNGDQVLGKTLADGRLEVERRAVRWSDGVRVGSDRHLESAVPKPSSDEPIRVRLEWRPAILDARVTDTNGVAVAVTLVARSDDGRELRGAPGSLELPPGHWTVEIVPPEGSGLATQSRQVDVSPSGAPPLPLDAVAIVDQGGSERVTLKVLDPDGRPISGARVSIDGLPVGTTADGGYLQVSGLTAADHAVVVQHESFTGQSLTYVIDGTGVAHPVVLQRQPGTVRVIAHDADGKPVPDAVVRFVGAVRLAPMPLGASGERTQVLSAGQWLAIVSSATYGIQERELVVSEDRIDLIEVLVVFQPMEEGAADLELRVVSPSGEPVDGATVAIDGRSVGATSTGGTLRIGPLASGLRTLEISGPELEPVSRSVLLQDGVQERVEQVRYLQGAVELTVRGPDGPVPGKAWFIQGMRRVEVPFGSTGRNRVVLPEAGAWTVTAASEILGVQQRAFEVSDTVRSLQHVDIFLQPAGGGAPLSLLVLDPDGRPVDGALVKVDGLAIGRTADGSAFVQDLTKGVHQVQILPPDGLASKQLPITLTNPPSDPVDVKPSTVMLDWAPHAVKVRVTSSGRPATDALVRLFRSGDVPRAMPVDTRGERVTTAAPGLWNLVVTSSVGVWQGEFEVKSSKLTTLDVDIKPVDPSLADLMVRVVDPDGTSVEDPNVMLSGAKLGEGEVGGTVLGRKLTPGLYQLLVSAPDFAPHEPVVVTLEAGEMTDVKVVLQWVLSRVVVHTVDAQGDPTDAVVSFRGPTDVAAEPSGADGEVVQSVRPGRYEVFAAAGDRAASGSLDVVLGNDPQPLVLELAPTRAVMAGESVRIGEMVQFDFGQATLRPDSAPILAEVARVLKSQPNIVRIEVQGHTDSVGAAAANATLSQARAESVLAALVALGVPREVLYAVGYGQTRPLSDNETEEGRATNRRVQFEVVERGL